MKRLWGNNGFFNWWKLRSAGNLYILKISYPVLLAMPLVSRYKEISQWLGIYNWTLLVTFFGSIALAMADLFYDLFCPIIVKRFDSPNTPYKEMLDIKIPSRR